MTNLGHTTCCAELTSGSNNFLQSHVAQLSLTLTQPWLCQPTLSSPPVYRLPSGPTTRQCTRAPSWAHLTALTSCSLSSHIFSAPS